jgi:predicted GNAT family N-acyltransferase
MPTQAVLALITMKEFIYKLVENDSELKGAFEVRRQVFTEEQGISEDMVFNDSDGEAMHMVVKDGERVIGTARVQFLDAKQAKLERMAVLGPFRRMGIGRRIISFLMEELKNRQIEKVALHAQHGVMEFYRACGFRQSGLPFWEAGIKHVKMERGL